MILQWADGGYRAHDSNIMEVGWGIAPLAGNVLPNLAR